MTLIDAGNNRLLLFHIVYLALSERSNDIAPVPFQTALRV